jgi:hypothetical protein
MEGVKTWLSSLEAHFFDTGIQKLVHQYKCLYSGGDYGAKSIKYVCIFVYIKVLFSPLLVLLTVTRSYLLSGPHICNYYESHITFTFLFPTTACSFQPLTSVKMVLQNKLHGP